MNRFVKKLYFFTKLTTSFMLLIFVVFLSYLLLVSYNNSVDDKKNISQNIDPLKSQIQQNQNAFKKDTEVLSKKISLLNNKTENIEKEINKITISLKSITELNNQIHSLKKQIYEMNTANLSKEKHNDNLLNVDINEKEKLKEIIIFKFKNNINYIEDIKLLEKLYGKENKHIFEKISILISLEFIGIDELNKSYFELSDQFIKSSIKNDQTIFPDFLLDLVTISPSENVKYSNQNIYYLKNAKNYLKDENISDAISSIKNIEGHEKYFSKWLKQAEIYEEFKDQIERI